MWISTDRKKSPVGISMERRWRPPDTDRPYGVELRIGEKEQGETRYTRMSPNRARQVAKALLSIADQADQENAEWERDLDLG